MINGKSKILIITPRKGETVDILETENYLIVYGHTKGNHWNVFGHHTKYFHSKLTGAYELLDSIDEKIIRKERLLKAKAISLNKLIYP